VTGALLAHATTTGGGGGGEANGVLILAGLAALAAALGLRTARQLAAPKAFAVAGLGVLLIGAGVVTTSEKQPAVTLTVLSPDPGASVEPDRPVPVSVEVKGGKVARSPSDSGGHLHLSVDGTLEQMPYGTTFEVTRPGGGTRCAWSMSTRSTWPTTRPSPSSCASTRF
jgi:hypothetical protein